jgi:cytochrome c-type biogenesis protein
VTGFSAALGGACWLGILTSISPCLLATNVTAIGFISRRLDQPRLVALSGTCYMAGQALGFIVLAALITGSIASVPLLSHGLQKYMFRLLGPIMLVTGLLLLEFIKIEFGRGRLKGWAQRFGEGGALWATMLLGLLFAMSFCPTTAALFFGGLIPMALEHESYVLLPFAYVTGVALPVSAIVLLVLFASQLLGRFVKRVGEIEWWMRRGTGALFIVVGTYFTVVYSLGVF